MPRYYCDYCDTYLTHDSPSVRKQHNAGYKHKANVRTYYQQFEEQQTQSLIDQRIKEHLGQAAAFQVGATFHQHLAAQRPRLPLLPTPVLPVPGGAPLVPGFRPPVLPRPPPGAPGYGAPPTMPQVGMPPVPSSVPMPMNGLPRPPTLNPPITSSMAPNPNGSAGMVNPAMYQAGPVATSGGYHSAPGSQSSAMGGPPPAASSSQDGFAYSQTSEANH